MTSRPSRGLARSSVSRRTRPAWAWSSASSTATRRTSSRNCWSSARSRRSRGRAAALTEGGGTGDSIRPRKRSPIMAFTLPPLPFEKNALAPHISAETLDYHHGKHHQAYVTNLNKLTEGKPEASKSLEEVILSSEGGVFNNAAQICNHTFYWNSLKPNGGGKPTGPLLELVNRDVVSGDTLSLKLG